MDTTQTTTTTNDAATLKREASKLLRQYDKMRKELSSLERDLSVACTAYGRSVGVWGFSREHMRMQLEREGDK